MTHVNLDVIKQNAFLGYVKKTVYSVWKTILSICHLFVFLL